MNCPFCGHPVGGHRFDASVPSVVPGDWVSRSRAAPPVPFTEATRETPSRPPTFEGDVLVPVCQALVTGSLAFMVILAASLKWGWSEWWAAGACLLVVAVSWFWLLTDSRHLLRTVETIIGKDLDGDGAVGSKTVKVEVVDEKARSVRFLDLPEEATKAVAVAVLKSGRAFSRRGLSGVISEGDFAKLSGAMVEAGLARYKDGKPQAGMELTGSGRAMLRKFL